MMIYPGTTTSTGLDSKVNPNATTPVNLSEEAKPLTGRIVEVKSIEVSLTDDTIRKLAQELARQINLMGVYR